MKPRAQVGLIGAALLGLIYSCGGDSVDGDGGGSPSGTSIGPDGGQVSEGGLTLSIPSGALGAPVTITVEETSMVTVPSGLVLVGPAYDLGPDGTTFDEPVLVRIELDDPPEGLTLVTLYHSSDGRTWNPAENSEYEERFEVVSGSIRHFSFVAPFASMESGGGGAPHAGGAGGKQGAAGESASGTGGAGGAVETGGAGGAREPVGGAGGTIEPGVAGAASDGGSAGAAAPIPICGNEVVEGNEQCDDGNLQAGDGCSPTCLIEIAP